MTQAPSETRFAVLLFSDIVGSTDLKARHGVPAYSAALRVHNEHFERIARECRGVRILQNMGDGYFAEAGSVAEAVRFALLFQDAMRAGPWGEIRLTTRVGIHAGEVTALVVEGGSGIVAPAADLAARVMSLAVGGQILLTRFPFDEARHFLREHPAVTGRDTPPLRWLAHGPYLLKGRDEPMDIFEVGAEGLAPLTPPPDGEKAKRAIRPGEEETLGWRPAIGLEIPGRPGWRLTERLGAGGFGEVWTGEHAKLRQRRAFKFCFDDERLRALKREVTLVRLLRTALGDRDDIVRFHELKLDEPPFYLESDLAPHGNLLQWAEKQGGLAAIPLAQRIGLVAHTATALAAAHSIGVLHKDIKPTNILIFDAPDGSVRPRLVDFGIGTLADQTVLGKHGVTAAGFTRATIEHSSGTPTYSPPEYLAGKPYTMQGDIYGLGVLLYQLITADSTRPIAPGWERDINDPLLREDLAACVDGDPSRRLASAAELTERLEKLDDRRAEREQLAVAARQATANQVRLARRRIQLRLAGLAILTLAGIAVALVWSYQREKRQRQQAEQQRQLAVEARNDAESLLRFMVFGLRDRLSKSADRELLRDINLRAAEYYRRLDTSKLNRDSLNQYAGSLGELGDALLDEGELQKAAELYGRCLEILTERRRRNPEAVFRSSIIFALGKVSDAAEAQGNLTVARSNLLQALSISRELTREHPERLGVQRWPSVFLARLADLDRLQQDLPEAIRHQREALEISRAIAAKDPQGSEALMDLATDESKLAALLSLAGDHAAAISLAESSLSAYRKLVQQHPADATALGKLLAGLSGFTERLLQADRFADAEAPAQEAIQISEQLAAKDPKNLEWQRNLAIAYAHAGDAASRAGKLEAARRHMEKAQEITEAAVAKEPGRAQWQRDLAFASARVAKVQALQGDREAAITNQTRSLGIRQTLAVRQPDNSEYQTDIAAAAGTLTDLHESRGEAGKIDALRYAKIELEALTRLQKANRLLPEQAARIVSITERIRSLEPAASR